MIEIFCPECGLDVAIDKDGLCVTCGATAVGSAVDRYVPRLRDSEVVDVEMLTGCLGEIYETLARRIDMDGCPPMFYPEAIENVARIPRRAVMRATGADEEIVAKADEDELVRIIQDAIDPTDWKPCPDGRGHSWNISVPHHGNPYYKCFYCDRRHEVPPPPAREEDR